jgi:hypothetical protein
MPILKWLLKMLELLANCDSAVRVWGEGFDVHP